MVLGFETRQHPGGKLYTPMGELFYDPINETSILRWLRSQYPHSWTGSIYFQLIATTRNGTSYKTTDVFHAFALKFYIRYESLRIFCHHISF